MLTGDVPEEADEEDVQSWIEATATGYIREIEANQPGGSYILGGTCVGGILAFEMAQQLRARGRQVPRLIQMDTPCPAGPSSPAVERVRHRLQGRMKRRALRQAKAIANHQLQSAPPEPAIGADAPTPDPNVLCRRHADAMVVPIGWTLDDRREDQPRLFKPRQAAKTPAATRRRKSGGAKPAAGEQLQIDGTGEIPRPAEAGAPSDPAQAWQPEFDHDDDLGGLLEVSSPLLARAFRGRDRRGH